MAVRYPSPRIKTSYNVGAGDLCKGLIHVAQFVDDKTLPEGVGGRRRFLSHGRLRVRTEGS